MITYSFDLFVGWENLGGQEIEGGMWGAKAVRHCPPCLHLPGVVAEPRLASMPRDLRKFVFVLTMEAFKSSVEFSKGG